MVVIIFSVIILLIRVSFREEGLNLTIASPWHICLILLLQNRAVIVLLLQGGYFWDVAEGLTVLFVQLHIEHVYRVNATIWLHTASLPLCLWWSFQQRKLLLLFLLHLYTRLIPYQVPPLLVTRMFLVSKRVLVLCSPHTLSSPDLQLWHGLSRSLYLHLLTYTCHIITEVVDKIVLIKISLLVGHETPFFHIMIEWISYFQRQNF